MWRYLPRVVDDSVRGWLRDSILAGTAEDVRMRLKGRLADFPYPRGAEQGEFRVAVKASAVDLRYAGEWPAIGSIRADVRSNDSGTAIIFGPAPNNSSLPEAAHTGSVPPSIDT